MNCIIAGTSLLNSSIFDAWERKEIKTHYGVVYLKVKGDYAFLQRHGDPPLPPHRINYKANIAALKEIGIKRAIAINSVGSLKSSIKPGEFIIPHDFIALWIYATLFEEEMKFTVPRIDSWLIDYIANICKEVNAGCHKGGVYIQTKGPRLETRAEIAFLRRFGHVVGMTMATEAILCSEYAIPYASLCSVDNYCNGIAKIPLTAEEIESNWQKNIDKIEMIIKIILKRGIFDEDNS